MELDDDLDALDAPPPQMEASIRAMLEEVGGTLRTGVLYGWTKCWTEQSGG